MNKPNKRVFITDCEGPVTKNDNAAEMAEAFLPHGGQFFSQVSLYDDYLAEVSHRPGYKAGDTLRLILPFFKAFGVDDRTMVKFSRRNVKVIPHAPEALARIFEVAPCYIVSTSYTPYIKAVCDALAFPIENTFSTEINIDGFQINSTEKSAVKDFYSRIIESPPFTLPQDVKSPDELSETARRTIMLMDEIFWRDLPKLAIYELLMSVDPVGGVEKANAVEKITMMQGCCLQDVMYVGDSITDVEAFRLVKKGGGLAVSFNGNNWAVKEAQIAVTASNALPTAFLAHMFLQHGIGIMEDLLVTHVNEETATEVAKQSVRVRKTVRSEKIGSLG